MDLLACPAASEEGGQVLPAAGSGLPGQGRGSGREWQEDGLEGCERLALDLGVLQEWRGTASTADKAAYESCTITQH